MNIKEIKEEFYDFCNPTIKGYEQSEDIDHFYPKKYNREIANWWITKLQEAYQQGYKEARETVFKSIKEQLNVGEKIKTR